MGDAVHSSTRCAQGLWIAVIISLPILVVALMAGVAVGSSRR